MWLDAGNCCVGWKPSHTVLPIFSLPVLFGWSLSLSLRIFFATPLVLLPISQDIWDLVKNGFPELANAAAYNALSHAEKDLLRDNRKKNSKYLFYIFQVVNESIFPRIVAETKLKQAWDTLQKPTKAWKK